MSANKPARPSSSCPCGSGSAFGGCCLPYHRGDREAPDAEALMRSRYSAFVCADVAYLLRTLHPEHDDRALPEEVLSRTLAAACRENRYLGLTVLSSSTDGDEAFVEFRARVFRKGVDHSFTERSRFGRVDGAWRYLDGKTV